MDDELVKFVGYAFIALCGVHLWDDFSGVGADGFLDFRSCVREFIFETVIPFIGVDFVEWFFDFDVKGLPLFLGGPVVLAPFRLGFGFLDFQREFGGEDEGVVVCP